MKLDLEAPLITDTLSASSTTWQNGPIWYPKVYIVINFEAITLF